jgi:arylsulfatase A-like enzyme
MTMRRRRLRRFDSAWRLGALVLAAVAWTALASPANGQQSGPPNVVVFVIDDTRWDSIGAAGNPIVRTPRLDAIAAEGVRFTQARVTTSICMTSRATLLTGQYMSRHGIDRFGKPLAPEAFAATYPGILRAAGYWTGYVGKYDVGPARTADFDLVRAYHGRHWLTDPTGERVHVTEQNARDALSFLRGRPRDRPFLLSVGFFAPHAEDSAPEQFLPQEWSAPLYEGVTVPPPLLGAPRHFEALPPFLAQDSNEGRVRFRWRFDTPERYQAYMLRYYRLITEVDAAIGRIVDELQAQGVYERTLIVFIGDNGYFHGDRGLADKWYPYEQALRVPLIVRDPRLPTGRRGLVRDELVLNLDIAPTVVAAAGRPVPPVMQGLDLGPLYLSTAPPPWRDEFFYEHPTITSRDRIPSSQGVIRRDWKYVRFPEFGYEQLFDLRTDGEEIRNLATDPGASSQLARMRVRLEEWRARAR